MKKRIFVFAIILIVVACSLFADNIKYSLICNEKNLNDELRTNYGKDHQFELDWAYYQNVYKSNPIEDGDLNLCRFRIYCGAGTEFGFTITDNGKDVDDYVVEYDPTQLTLVTKTISKEIVSPRQIKAKISIYREVFFKANPVLENGVSYISIIGDADSIRSKTINATVFVNTAANTQGLWELHTKKSVSDESRNYSSISNYRTPLVSGMSFNPLPLEEFYLYPSGSVNRIGYVANSDLYVVKYDSAYVECNAINTTETRNYKKLYGIVENTSEKIVVVNGKNGIKFTRNNNLETSYKTTAIEVVPYPFFMDSKRSVKVVLNVGKWEKVEMANDKTTRLYRPYPEENIVSKNNFDIKTRGLSVGNNEITVEWKNFNTISHLYHYYLETLNYKGSISAYSNYEERTTSSQEMYGDFVLNLSSSAFRHEDYQNNEEVKIRLHVLDVTDNVDYYYDFEYPLEDFTPNYWTISDFTTATNGDVNTGTLVDTNVYFDFKVNATTPQDQFDYVYLVIYDNTRTKVYSTRFELTKSSDATSGTFSSGWGNNQLFSYLRDYFSPKKVGKYYVDIYGWNKYGNYNIGKYSTTFNVSK